MKEAFEKIRKIFHERVMASELKVRELDDLPFNIRKCYDEMDLEDARSQSFEEALSIVSEVEAEFGKDINVLGNGKTNADRIRSMSDEELAEFLIYSEENYKLFTSDGKDFYTYEEALKHEIEWLKSLTTD